MRRRAVLAAAAAAAFECGCGYHISGHADVLPATVHSIAIPAFDNLTDRYTLSELLPGAIAREFLSRTRYRVSGDPEQADSVLRGSIVNYLSFPNVTDPTSGRASGIQISVYLQLTLTERKSGKVLYSRPNMEFRQRYEISATQAAYFEESEMALERLSRDVARTVVSSVLEAF